MSEPGGGPRTHDAGGVIAAFAARAREAPGRVAVREGDRSLTYAELDRRSRALAGGLRDRGVTPGDRVMLALGRSIDFIVSVVGIVRAGGVYVPVDPCWPAERLATLAGIVSPAVTIASDDARDAGTLSEVGGVVTVSQLESSGLGAVAGDSDRGVDHSQSPDDPIYAMFTSGTTGEPKGVLVPHRAVGRLVLDPDYMDIGAADADGTPRVWLHLAATSFDAATLEIWAPLTNGHTIAVVADALPSLERIARVIGDQGVTDAWLTASLFNAMVDFHSAAFGGMKQVLTGGERLSTDHVRRFLDRWPGVRLINGYGPTENTTFTCCRTIERGDPDRAHGVPIGAPIRGTRVRIVDERLNDVADGTPGELLAGGEGVALGYLNDATLTAEKFVEVDGAVWYRTGDLVSRASADEPIAFVGRRDRQVKVRGHRIELEEVERVLRSHPGVASAFAATLGERADERRLSAAYEPASGADGVAGVDEAELQAWVAARAPKPLVPDLLVRLGSVPIGATGKADRSAIERLLGERSASGLGGETETGGDGSDSDGPAKAIEREGGGSGSPAWERLETLLAEILPDAAIARDASFVAVGGHSLAALRLSALARARHGIGLPIAAILNSAKLAELAEWFESAEYSEGYTEPAPALSRRASSIQRQFFFEHAVDPTGVAYLEHAAFLVGSAGFTPGRMIEAVSRLIARHEALRTRLVMGEDELVQATDPAEGRLAEWCERVRVHEETTRDPAGLVERVRVAVSRPFDLEGEWPIRLDLFPLEGGSWAVVLTFQHAAIDEWSLRIIARELGVFYDNPDADLGPAVPYSAYSTREFRDSDARGADEVAESLLSIDIPSLRTGRAPAEAVLTQSPWIGTEAMSTLSARLGATPTAVSAGLFASAIAGVTGMRRVALLTPVSRRLDAGLQSVVGCCNMMHPIVVETSDPASRRGIERVIASASASFAEAYARSPVPFELVVRAMHARGVGSAAAVPFGFAFETNDPFCPASRELDARPLPIRSPIARFPVGLSIDARGGEPVAVFSAPRASGAQEQLDRFADEIRGALGRLVSDAGEDPRIASGRPREESARSVRREEHDRVRAGKVELELNAARRAASDAWEAVLGRAAESDRAHFFDSGGHSLLLLRLAARIRAATGAEIPLGPFLDTPVFGKLVELVGRRVERGAGDAGDAGFQIEEFGSGDRVIVCIPGAFGRPVLFGKLAERFASRGSPVRLRCYNVFDAMSERSVPEGFDRVRSQLSRDFERPETVGMLGFCAGGLYPLFLEALPESRMRRLRLWLLNVFAPEEADAWLPMRIQSVRDALLDPGSLPGAVRDSAVTLWRMAMVRLRAQEAGVHGDQFTHAELQKVLARRSLGEWRGGATVVIAGRKPIWRIYFRNSLLNGLASHLQGPTRTVVLPLMHHEMLSTGAEAIAEAIDRDIETLAREERA